MSAILNVILCHLPPTQTDGVMDFFRQVQATNEECLLVYGGEPQAIHGIQHEPKVLSRQNRLRVGQDLQRSRQNYTEVFQAVSDWMATQPEASFKAVSFMEYDELPLTAERGQRLWNLLESEKADVLGHRLRRVDLTNSPLWLAHAADRNFTDFWSKISVREDPQVVLQMLGTGSFWRRKAFDAVASVKEPFPIYLELWLPTVAHHLGFRVRPLPDHRHAVSPQPLSQVQIRAALADSSSTALSVHPVKSEEDFRLVTETVLGRQKPQN